MESLHLWVLFSLSDAPQSPDGCCDFCMGLFYTDQSQGCAPSSQTSCVLLCLDLWQYIEVPMLFRMHTLLLRWQQSKKVARCRVAARISSYGCVRVTSCCEHQRGVIFKLAWSCRHAFLDHLRTQLGAVNAVSRLASLHPRSHFREGCLGSSASNFLPTDHNNLSGWETSLRVLQTFVMSKVTFEMFLREFRTDDRFYVI